MLDELKVQQVIQYTDTKRIDRIVGIDKDSGLVNTIELYCLYNEDEWRETYERRKLNSKKIKQLEEEQGKLVEEWQLEKLKEEQVKSNMETKAKQAKFLEGISQNPDEKFCLVTNITFHAISIKDLEEDLRQNKVRYVIDPKDRSIEELINRQKQDQQIKKEQYSSTIKLMNQGRKRYKTESEKRYERWDNDLERALEICEKVFNEERVPSVFNNGRSMGKIVNELSKEYNLTPKTIYKYLRKYLQGGSVPYALYNDFYTGNAIQNKVVTKHIGRKSTGATKDCETGVIVTEEMQKLFAFAICRWYETKEGHSLKSTHKKLISKLFKQEKESEEGKVKGVLPIPTYKQFTYWYNHKYKDISISIINKEGEKYFLNNKKGQLADILSEVTGPMQLVYVDATVVDIYLIDRSTGEIIVNRPTLYVGIDCYSQMIVGVSITLEPPGIMPARTLLYNMIQDKRLYAKELGVSIKKEEWPSQGMPKIIMGDRGEMISDDFKTIIRDFNSTLKNASPYLGAAKGLVEQVFNTVNLDVNKWAPGYVDKHYNSRRQPDYRLDAKLDLREFTQIMIKKIVHHNKKAIVNRKPTPDMIKEGIKITPIGLWEYGKKFTGALSDINENNAVIKLLREGEAVLTSKGLKFGGGYYRADHPDFYSWKTEARVKGVKKFIVRYDNRCVDHIFLMHLQEGKVMRCTLDLNFHESKNIEHKSYEEVMAYEEAVKELKDSQAREQIENDNEFIDYRDSQIAQTIKENKAIKPNLKDSKDAKHQVRDKAKKDNALINKVMHTQAAKSTPNIESEDINEVDEVPSMDDLISEFEEELLKEMGVE